MAYGRIGGFNIRRYTFEPISKAKEEEELKEGDYTTWTHKWSNTLANGIGLDASVTFHINDKNNVLSLMWYDASSDQRFGIYNLSDFSTVFQSAAGSDYAGSGSYTEYIMAVHYGIALLYSAAISVSLQTYILLLRAAPSYWHIIEVWRGGSSALWTRDVRDDEAGATIRVGAISPTGKWILLFDYTNNKLMLYEGS